MHFFHIVADGTWQTALLKITQLILGLTNNK